MKRVRLSFLFMTFCAQRYSDVRNLKRRDLIINSEGSVDWNLFQLKGSRSQKIVVPLLPAAIELLDQLKFREMRPDDFVIPIGCNQWMNRAIKKMCKDVGIDTPTTVVKIVGGTRTEKSVPKYKLISCHTSRRSFVSISLKRKLNSEYLSSITGHSSVKTMRLYLGLNQEAKREALIEAWSNEKK